MDSKDLQVDFYSLYGGVEKIRQSGPGSLRVLGSMITESEKNYLNREDAITSLLRRKKERTFKLSKLSDIFSAKALEKEGMALLVNTLTEYVRKLLIESIVTGNDGRKEFNMSDDLKELLGDDKTNEALLYFKGCRFYQYGSHVAAYFVTKQYSDISSYSFLPTTVSDKWSDGCIAAYTVGKLSPSKRGKKYYTTGRMKETMTRINDAALLLARAVMYAEVKRAFDEDEEFRKFIYGQINMPLWYYEEFKGENVLICDSDIMEQAFKAMGLKYRRISEPAVGNKIGNTYVAVPSCTAVKDNFMLPAALSGVLIPNGYFTCGFNGVYFATSFERSLVCAYQHLLRRDAALKMMHSYEKQSSGDYALSFMTKKNIPEKIVNRMQSSSFNNSFGYIEFDEDCDLEKITEIECEWEAMCKNIFGQRKYGDVSLRFRRLGNHNASGLYYSAVRCICVDIRTPSSMLHEFMHMIDDGTLTGIRGDYLSLRNDFTKIRDYYSQLIDKAKVSCKGKYGKSYYKTPTEIFARCAEMYVSRVLGVNNSLIKEEHGFAYPDDPVLMKYITEYFDMLFVTAFSYERKVAA